MDRQSSPDYDAITFNAAFGGRAEAQPHFPPAILNFPFHLGKPAHPNLPDDGSHLDRVVPSLERVLRGILCADAHSFDSGVILRPLNFAPSKRIVCALQKRHSEARPMTAFNTSLLKLEKYR